jgi:hypothetical protein
LAGSRPAFQRQTFFQAAKQATIAAQAIAQLVAAMVKIPDAIRFQGVAKSRKSIFKQKK